MSSLFDGYVNILKQEFGGTKAVDLQSLFEERSAVYNHTYHSATEFAVSAKEGQNKLPTLYWLPKIYKRPYKARFIANPSSCTTTELFKWLTYCHQKACTSILRQGL